MVYKKIVGIQALNYTSKKTGNPVSARNIFLEYKDDNVQGVKTENLFLSNSKFGNEDLRLGMSIAVAYNQFGQPDFILYEK